MIKITNDVYVNPKEVSSVEKHVPCSPSGGNVYYDRPGSVVTLQNGRKIYIAEVLPEVIMSLLSGNPKI